MGKLKYVFPAPSDTIYHPEISLEMIISQIDLVGENRKF